eukprot:gene28950-32144_t
MIRPWDAPIRELRGPFQISWPGCGILVFWQLGVLKRLSETLDTQKLSMLGSSSGALVSCLAACGVDGERASRELVHLIGKSSFTKGLGIFGRIGSIGEQWLGSLLPPDAASKCSSRSAVLLTSMPTCITCRVDTFASRQDVIDMALASSHLPLLLNGKFFAKEEYHPPDIKTLIIHPTRDEVLDKRYNEFQNHQMGGLGERARELFKYGRDFVDRRLLINQTSVGVIIHQRPVQVPGHEREGST